MLQLDHLAHIPSIAEPLQNEGSANREQQYHATMTQMRQANLASFSSDSRMPFALKQRQIERPMLEYTVSLALSSPRWRQIIVDTLIENIERGPGHFSVHRAKEALKQIASAIGVANLSSTLKSQDTAEARQAANLLGWLKNPDAARLLQKSLQSNHPLQSEISAVISRHYGQYRIIKE